MSLIDILCLLLVLFFSFVCLLRILNILSLVFPYLGRLMIWIQNSCFSYIVLYLINYGLFKLLHRNMIEKNSLVLIGLSIILGIILYYVYLPKNQFNQHIFFQILKLLLFMSNMLVGGYCIYKYITQDVTIVIISIIAILIISVLVNKNIYKKYRY